MTLQRTTQGLEVRVRPRGFGRFISAGFLAFWLCGWALGEGFALFLLVRGGRALWTGESPSRSGEPLQIGPALAMGLFLLFWLTFWTFGGIMAFRELLRLVWSEVRLVAGADLIIHRQLGPFRSTVAIGRHDLRRIYSIPGKGRLLAETAQGTVDLAQIPYAAEREEIEKALNAELRIGDPASAGGAALAPGPLPEGWSEIVDPEGGVALIGDPVIRRRQARVAWAIALIAAAVSYGCIVQALRAPDLWGLTAVVGVVTAALIWGAWRLSMTRLEWRLGGGRLILRRRTGAATRDLFEAGSLELVETSDSDGDPWFTLNAVAAGVAPGVTGGTAVRRTRRRIAHAMDDPTTPRRLGAWLASKARLALDDQAPSERKREQLAHLISQLESSGRFGAWMANRLPRN